MAKRRSVNQSRSTRQLARQSELPQSSSRQLGLRNPQSLRWLAAALLAALLAVSMHWTADSVGVEQGLAVYHVALALLPAVLVALSCLGQASAFGSGRSGMLLDIAAWALAAWIVISAWALSDQLELRRAAHEAWLWIAGAACFTAARRLFATAATRRTLAILLVLAAVVLSVHGWHQLLVSLPADVARFETEPEAVLAEAGLDDAPPGSARRMMFANRLRDGGPTATFALTNSLAGVLVMAWLLTVGWLCGRWRVLPAAARGGLVVAALLSGSLLLRTNSRAAIGAVAIVMLAWAVWLAWSRIRYSHGGGRRAIQTPQRLLVAVAGVCLLVIAGYVATNREITERAWASLSFRWQYWQATASIVADSPWFGCGPGNFQQAYQGYQAAETSEQPADPHNFVMETAASGGLPAVALLILLGGAAGVRWRRGRGVAPEAVVAPEADVAPEASAFGSGRAAVSEYADAGQSLASAATIGFLVGWALVWMVGLVIGQWPDLGAHLWAVPVGVVVAVLLLRWPPAAAPPQWVGIGVVIGLLIHLSFSGGWIVPGVAVGLWLWAGATLGERATLAEPASRRQTAAAPGRFPISVSAVLVALAALGLLVAFYWTELRPTTESGRWRMQAAFARDLPQAEQALLRAIEADPWASQPRADLADLYRRALLFVDDPALRRRLEQASTAASETAAGDPALLAFLGEVRMHLYQRWQREEDLQAAARWYRLAAEGAPVNERYAAQLAVIYTQQGDPQAARWAQTARRLAQAGGHIERSFDLINVLPAKAFGQDAAEAPVRAPAAEVLPNPTPSANVTNG